jgi:hypothetical protein
MPPKQPLTAPEIDNEKAAQPSISLVPARAIMAAARSMTAGVAKHGGGHTGRGTYRDADSGGQCLPETHLDSCLRHLLKYQMGDLFDDGTGLSHLDCAIAQLAVVIDLVEDPVVGPALAHTQVLGEIDDATALKISQSIRTAERKLRRFGV